MQKVKELRKQKERNNKVCDHMTDDDTNDCFMTHLDLTGNLLNGL